ncbi:DUF3027 domain-containing protein [Nesterenkonia flava]|uniref:DUF3027 domain-containing protein n=1 Tax=Nesterenkonia flava TaxID=469799 RepID=A0ABU1FVD4_9MICC|nr:DUF3027 domain-containing protein [Nesterenkonia flava]MDR5712621.1 DUF3027 domain-containing protein [Nesterenkonia flava]
MPTYKKDTVLAEAQELARTALAEIAPQDQIGEHLSISADGDRLLTHRFAASKPGYHGWEWFVTLARAPRSKKPTVCELGLLPGAGALLAPEWVPWSERVSEEEKKVQEQQSDKEAAEA